MPPNASTATATVDHVNQPGIPRITANNATPRIKIAATVIENAGCSAPR